MEIERAGGALEVPGDALEVSGGVVLLVQDAELSILHPQASETISVPSPCR